MALSASFLKLSDTVCSLSRSAHNRNHKTHKNVQPTKTVTCDSWTYLQFRQSGRPEAQRRWYLIQGIKFFRSARTDSTR